ncbi:MAG: hypothetical protein GY857_17520 [Desulfobacula sp.]|nr:hypothetical protein [Desulfobacula sp.]
MQDIHGILPPVQVGFDPMILKIILMVSCVALLLILLFFLLKKMWKKKKLPNDLKLLPQPLPAYETALKQLDLLLQSMLHDPRIFYFNLSAILRDYIGRSFNINAMEMTSQEFIKNIIFLDIDRKITKEISNFLTLSDSFKYAGTTPQKDQADKDLVFIKDNICKIENDLSRQREEKEQAQEREQKQRPKTGSTQ